MIRKNFGRYLVLRKVGQGGIGEVYLAHDTLLDRRVALKFLLEAHPDPVARERFVREARSAAAIDHPYICKVYEAGEFQAQAFIAMEFIEGETLEQRLAAGPFAWIDAVRIAGEVTEVLCRAHEKGVVHRDLKPSNIMLTEDGHVKVVDFGLAKRLTNEDQETLTGSPLTGTGAQIGTLTYMSPEQLRARTVDHRSDIFSLGIILYELVTGIHPFRKASPMETAMATMKDTPTSITRYCKDCPPGLSRVVDRMLGKELPARYDSARQLLDDLQMSQLCRPLVSSTVRASCPSVAVLPFVNLSADPNEQYFTDGITEDIIAQLSKISGIKVIARRSVMRYQDTDKTMADIGRELRVSHVVKCSLHRMKNRIRLRCGLVDTETERQLWGEVYNRELDDIFTIQAELSKQIAQALSTTLVPDRLPFPQRGPAGLEAYQRYLKGRYFLNKLTSESIRKGLEYLRAALQVDPQYARAWAGISTCYASLGHFDFMPRSEAFPAAKDAALHALDLDDSLSEAHTSMALVYLFHEWDWQGADRSFRRAIELNDSSAEAHTYYSWALIMMGRFEEALTEGQKALEIDPLSPFVSCNFGWLLVLADRCDEALEHFAHILEMEPSYFPVHSLMGLAYVGKGMYDQAIEHLQFSWRRSMLGVACALAGRTEEARKILAEITEPAQQSGTPPSEIALIYLFLGEREPAARWFDRAYEQRDYTLVLNVRPTWAPERHDPLVLAYLNRMGLKP